MNYLINGYCEGCGSDLVDEFISSEGGEDDFIAVLSIHTDDKIPRVITEIQHQQHVAAGLCGVCFYDVVGARTRPSMEWKACSGCGDRITDCDIAFRLIEVEANEVETHFMVGKNREMLSAERHLRSGSYSVCLDCMGAIAEEASNEYDKQAMNTDSILRETYAYASRKGNWR